MPALRHASVIGATTVLGAVLIPAFQAADTNKNPPPPSSNTLTLIGSMNVARFGNKTVLLNNGEVLAVTGAATGANTAELYHPATGTSTLTAGSPAAIHYNGSVTLLPNGEVLLAGVSWAARFSTGNGPKQT